MDLLAIGARIALAWRHHREKIERYGAYGLLLSLFAAIGLAVCSRIPGFTTYANKSVPNVWIYEFSLIGCTGIILWALSGQGVRPLTWSPVRFIGVISYSMYLIHTLPIVLLRNRNLPRCVDGLIAFAVTVLWATASWYWLEKPLLK